jgi:hypothetical protein
VQSIQALQARGVPFSVAGLVEQARVALTQLADPVDMGLDTMRTLRRVLAWLLTSGDDEAGQEPLIRALTILVVGSHIKMPPAPGPLPVQYLTAEDVFPGLVDDAVHHVLSFLPVTELVRLNTVCKGLAPAAFMALAWRRRFMADYRDKYTGAVLDGALRAVQHLEAAHCNGLQWQRTYLSYNLVLQCVARLATSRLFSKADPGAHDRQAMTCAGDVLTGKLKHRLHCPLTKDIGVQRNRTEGGDHHPFDVDAFSVIMCVKDEARSADNLAQIAEVLNARTPQWNLMRQTRGIEASCTIDARRLAEAWPATTSTVFFAGAASARWVLDQSWRFGTAVRDIPNLLASGKEVALDMPFVRVHTTGTPAAPLSETTRPSHVIRLAFKHGCRTFSALHYINLDDQAREFLDSRCDSVTPGEEVTKLSPLYPWRRHELGHADLHKFLAPLESRWCYRGAGSAPLSAQEEDTLCANWHRLGFWPIDLLSRDSDSNEPIKTVANRRRAVLLDLLDYFYGSTTLPSLSSSVAAHRSYYHALEVPAFVRNLKDPGFCLG